MTQIGIIIIEVADPITSYDNPRDTAPELMRIGGRPPGMSGALQIITTVRQAGYLLFQQPDFPDVWDVCTFWVAGLDHKRQGAHHS